jgi:hypothetical protein
VGDFKERSRGEHSDKLLDCMKRHKIYNETLKQKCKILLASSWKEVYSVSQENQALLSLQQITTP